MQLQFTILLNLDYLRIVNSKCNEAKFVLRLVLLIYFKQAIFYRLIWIENQFFFQFAVFLCAYILKREQNITKASQTTKWMFTIETISCVQVSLS